MVAAGEPRVHRWRPVSEKRRIVMLMIGPGANVSEWPELTCEREPNIQVAATSRGEIFPLAQSRFIFLSSRKPRLKIEVST
jgi:hypothetical protein